MAEKSKILVVGGTGYIGKFIIEASVKAGHPTFAHIRQATISTKTNLIHNFANLGVTIISGDLNDQESLVKAIKQVDVVISSVGRSLLDDQVKLIDAVKEAGNVKRFLPSEFGNDPDHSHGGVGPAKSMFEAKSKIRRAVEAQGIPYTYICSNFFAGYVLPNLAQLGATSPPRDKVVIWGDGTPKVVINSEEDISTFTIRAVDDPRTLNKTLYIRPPANTYSFNELVLLWGKKIDKTLHKVYKPEEQLLEKIRDSINPEKAILAIIHSALVKGDHTNFDNQPIFGVEASKLYPDVKYTTVDEYLNKFM